MGESRSLPVLPLRPPRLRLRRALAVAGLAVVLATGSNPRAASGQALSSAAGFAGGLVGGAYVTTGLYVLKSRATGWVLHSPRDLVSPRAEALPMLAAPLAGAVLGYRTPDRLSSAASWGLVGLVGGGAAGVLIGQLIWGDSGGRWAGGTIGSAIGLAIGAIAGAVTGGEDEAAVTPVAERRSYLSFSLPLGGHR